MVKGKETSHAVTVLKHTEKRASAPLAKLIESAIANVRNAGAGPKDLFFVANLTIDKGIVMKRSMPRARGRAFPIKKRTSHVTVTVARMKAEAPKKVEKKETTVKAPTSVKTTAGKPAAKKPAAKKVAAKKKEAK